MTSKVVWQASVFSNGLATSRILMTLGGGELTLGQEVAMPTRATQRYERCDAEAERLFLYGLLRIPYNHCKLAGLQKKATFNCWALALGMRSGHALRVLGTPKI